MQIAGPGLQAGEKPHKTHAIDSPTACGHEDPMNKDISKHKKNKNPFLPESMVPNWEALTLPH